jgi:type I restriction enzyme R subunit
MKREKLVFDWRKRQQTRATVHMCIEKILDRLHKKYDTEVYQQRWEPEHGRKRFMEFKR